jgi:hypothetical protein
MDFAKVLDTVSRFLDEHGYRYVLVGAFALAAHGLSRATQDVDFAIEARAQPDLVSFLESLGYETIYRSEGYSNHAHALPALGRVDVIYVGEPTGTKLFKGATTVTVSGKAVRVPRPEHLAAMKVLAMKNDPMRTFQEMADLQHILALPGIDAEEIRGYFERHGLSEKYDEIRRILDSAQP